MLLLSCLKSGREVMRIKLDDNWRRYYDEEHDRIDALIPPMVCFSARASRGRLRRDVLPDWFCVDDAAPLFSLKKKCRDFESKEQRASWY